MVRRLEPPDDGGMDQPGFRRAFEPLRNRDFALFWGAGLLSNVFSWVSALAVPFVLFQITGSALWVGAAAAAEFLPSVVIGPVAGVLADRFDRRKLLLLTQSGAAIAALLLWAEWAAGVREPALLLLPVLLFGVFEAINTPAWQAFVPDLLPRRQLRAGVSVNSIQFNASRAIGPALAGVLLATIGASWVFLLNALSFLVVLGVLVAIRPIAVQLRSATARRPFRQFVHAARYAAARPGLVVAVAVSIVFGLFGNPVYSLTIIVAEEVLFVDAVGLGLMNAMLGLGSVVGAALLTWSEPRVQLSRAVACGVGGLAAGLLALALAPGYAATLVILFLSGVALIWMMAGVNTALQFIVADRMRGRVVALRHTALRTAIPLGALATGYVTDWAGVQWAFLGCGVATAIGFLVLMMIRNGLRRLDDPQDADDTA